MSVEDNTEQEDSTKQRATTRQMANDAPEAKMQVRAMHSRVAAWKLSKRILALSAQPVDLAHIAEVMETQFASDELVAIAAKCLTKLLEIQN